MPVSNLPPAPPTGTVINERQCVGCGYNLRGLPVGGRCPECGMPIASESRFDEPLAHSPVEVIKAFRLGCWFATVVMFSAAVTIVARSFRAVPAEAIAAILGVLAMLWLAATWMVTPSFTIRAAAARGFGPTSRLRMAARALQFGWLACASCYALVALYSTQLGGWVGLVRLGMIVSAIVGFAGVVCLGILLERLAEWARDDDAERALNLAVWGVPITTSILFLNTSMFLLSIVIALIWLMSVLAFPYGMLSLSRSVSLSVSHAREYQNRERRRYERQQEYVQQIADTVEKMDKSRDQPR